MEKSITISEENYNFWKTGAIISAIVTIITFTIFWNLEDPFWISIFRLGAFIFFAITILCYLQIMNGPIDITLNTTGEKLLVLYFKNGKKVQEEEFKKETIKEVIPTVSGINFLLRKLKPSLKTFKISFTDTNKDLHLFEFSGRPLLFSQESQKKILRFFNKLF